MKIFSVVSGLLGMIKCIKIVILLIIDTEMLPGLVCFSDAVIKNTLNKHNLGRNGFILSYTC